MIHGLQLSRLQWKQQVKLPSGHNELAYRCLGNGLHLIQDTFAHMNNGRIPGTDHAMGTITVNDEGVHKLVGDPTVMDDPNWDNNDSDSTAAELRVSDAYNVNYWHKHATDFTNSYRYKQAVELGIKYMNAFVSGSAADFDKALQLGYVQNGNTANKYYINYINKVVVDNTNTLCTFDSFTPQSARYIKVTGTNLRQSLTGDYRMQFAEIEIY